MCTYCNPDETLLSIIGLVVLGFVFCSLGAVYVAVLKRYPDLLTKWVSTFTIFFGHIQTVAIISNLKLSWPPRVQAATGLISEVFACGTAAVITPVGTVKHSQGEVVVGGGEPGPVTMRLRDQLTAIQRGTAPDTHSWMHTLVP